MKHFINYLITGSLYFISLGIIFLSLMFFTESVLAPWSHLPAPMPWETIFPPDGSWQATLNQFFATSPGKYVLSLPIALCSLYFALRAFRQHHMRVIQLAISNFLFLAMYSLATRWLYPVNQILFDDMSTVPVRYEGAILPLIVLTIVTIIWIYAQAQLTREHNPTYNTNRKQKKQNSEQLDAIKRLQDSSVQSDISISRNEQDKKIKVMR